MNTTLPPVPDLPPHRHAQIRATLVRAASEPRQVTRLIPVAATVVAVAGLVAGVVWLTPGDAGTRAAGPPTTAPSTAHGPVNITSDDLIARFRVVLGDTATFEVTTKETLPPPSSANPTPPPPGTGSVVTPGVEEPDPDGRFGAIAGGTLTSAGVTGGFFLSVHPNDSEPCRLTRADDCEVSTLPDGSQLTTAIARPAPGAVSYMAGLKRPDGTMVLMFLSNQEDPLGTAINTPGGEIYSAQPPLTLDQLKAIVTSDKW
jgi:hypothetical protein